MDTIIYEVTTKIINEFTNSFKTMLNEEKDISYLIINMKKTLDEIGVEMIKFALESVDEMIRESSSRKKTHYVQRRDDEKTLITIFGDVNYKRTYYKNKKDGSYSYLSDKKLGIEPYERMDLSYKAGLVRKTLDLSYQKSAESMYFGSKVSNQTVMNTIRELGPIENNSVGVEEPKKEVRTIYIEADEDHVSMQDGTNKQVRLIYVHEGKKLKSKGRYQLKNPRYFTGQYRNSEDLWIEVADYLEEAYNLEKVDNIYLSGDGAKWIKEGLNWIDNSKYVLDYFHLSKYVKKATAHLSYTTPILWNYINKGDKKSVKDLFDVIIDETESETKRKAVKESRKYIFNNWEGIMNRYEDDYVGCSAEGHVSHILSDRLSSRPLGWSEIGADQMARLRVYSFNGGNIYKIMKEKKEENAKKERILELDERVIKRRLKISLQDTLGNIPAIKAGKRTWERQILKSAKGL